MSNIKNFRDFIAAKLKEEEPAICIEEAYYRADNLWESAMKRRRQYDIEKLNTFANEYYRAQ